MQTRRCFVPRQFRRCATPRHWKARSRRAPRIRKTPPSQRPGRTPWRAASPSLMMLPRQSTHGAETRRKVSAFTPEKTHRSSSLLCVLVSKTALEKRLKMTCRRAARHQGWPAPLARGAKVRTRRRPCRSKNETGWECAEWCRNCCEMASFALHHRERRPRQVKKDRQPFVVLKKLSKSSKRLMGHYLEAVRPRYLPVDFGSDPQNSWRTGWGTNWQRNVDDKHLVVRMSQSVHPRPAEMRARFA